MGRVCKSSNKRHLPLFFASFPGAALFGHTLCCAVFTLWTCHWVLYLLYNPTSPMCQLDGLPALLDSIVALCLLWSVPHGWGVGGVPCVDYSWRMMAVWTSMALFRWLVVAM